jgi:hypothetical protein
MDPRTEDPERGRGYSARVKETGNMDGDPSTCCGCCCCPAHSPEQEMEIGNYCTRATNIHKAPSVPDETLVLFFNTD